MTLIYFCQNNFTLKIIVVGILTWLNVFLLPFCSNSSHQFLIDNDLSAIRLLSFSKNIEAEAPGWRYWLLLIDYCWLIHVDWFSCVIGRFSCERTRGCDTVRLPDSFSIELLISDDSDRRRYCYYDQTLPSLSLILRRYSGSVSKEVLDLEHLTRCHIDFIGGNYKPMLFILVAR